MKIIIVARGEFGKKIATANMRLIAAIEALAEGHPDYKPEDFSVEIDPTDVAPPAPKTHYVAKLPVLTSGAFDVAKVPETVRKNLEDLGEGSTAGVIYQDIVDATLAGQIITEPDIRAKRNLKTGTSQGRIQQMRKMGIIESRPIVYSN